LKEAFSAIELEKSRIQIQKINLVNAQTTTLHIQIVLITQNKFK
jgi:hypothetical protein